jgi:phosphatidylinositol glycan class Z
LFPLWVFYGGPLTINWLTSGNLYLDIFSCSEQIVTLRLGSAWALAISVRLTVLLWSFALDFLLKKIIESMTQVKKDNDEATTSNGLVRRLMAVYGFSYPVLTYLLRPFSNTYETILLAFIFLIVNSIPTTERLFRRHQWVLGALCAFGCFIRITFPAFAAPVLLYHWYWQWIDQPSGVKSIWKTFRSMVLPMLTGSLVITVLGVIVDTWSYTSFIYPANSKYSNWIFTPLSNFLYNFKTENLAEHGLHHRWTHVLINMPLLFLPLLILIAMCYKKTYLKPLLQRRRQCAMASCATGLFALSLMPHQEPRFLLPLLIPLVIIISTLPQDALRSSFGSKSFYILFCLFNGALTLLFHFWHQGGVIPCFFWLGNNCSESSRTIL